MPDTSTLFEMMAADHRRRILLGLCQMDPMTVPDDVAMRGETGTRQGGTGVPGAGGTPTVEDPEALEVRLRHSHLPKLAGADLVEWDREARTVSRGPDFDEIEPGLHALALNAEKFPDGMR